MPGLLATIGSSVRRGLKSAKGALIAVVVVLTVVAFIATVGFGFSQAKTVEVITVGVLLALASSAIGSVVGFIFGIPKSNMSADGKSAYGVNTSLEQISDWLVKIVVGVGLIEARNIATRFGSLCATLSPAMGGGSVGSVAAGVVIAFFLPIGFLVAYPATRTVVLDMFRSYEAISISMRTVTRGVSEEVRRMVAAVHVAALAPGEDGGVPQNREPVDELPEPPVAPVLSVTELRSSLDQLLAELVRPLSAVSLTSGEIVDVLVRRGLFKQDVADAIVEILRFTDDAGVISIPSGEDAKLRTDGDALLSTLSKLRKFAPRIAETHILDVLGRAANERGWPIQIDRKIGETSVDASVGTTAPVLVEVRTSVFVRDGALEDLRRSLEQLPDIQRVVVVLLGDSTATLPPAFELDSQPTILMWDSDADQFIPTVQGLLNEARQESPAEPLPRF